MWSLIRKELRELAWAPVVWLGAFVLVAAIVRFRAYPEPYYGVFVRLWLFAMPILALQMGASGPARERVHGWLQWETLWPVSRRRWWLAKVLVQLAAMLLVFGLTLLVVRLAAYGLDLSGVRGAEHLADRAVLSFAVSLCVFGLGFLMSGICRGPLEAFAFGALAACLIYFGWYYAMAEFLPDRYGPLLGLSLAGFAPVQMLTVAVVLCLCFLAASAGTVSLVPPLEFGRKWWRAIALAVLLAAAGMVLLVTVWAQYPGPRRPAEAIDTVAISPDRSLIAFTDRDAPSGNVIPRLWTLHATGQGLRCVARGPAQLVAWLPHSHTLLVAYGEHGNVADFHWYWLLDGDSGALTRLPVTGGMVSLSPTGRYLLTADGVFDLQQGQWLAGAADLPLDYAPLWLPDESGVLVQTVTTIELHTLDGRHRQLIKLPRTDSTTRVRRACTVQPPWLIVLEERMPDPRVVYGYPPRPEDSDTTMATVLINLRTRRTIRVPRLRTYPDGGISPDGRLCLMRAQRELAVVDLHSGRVTRRYDLKRPAKRLGTARWSPDGRWVAVEMRHWPATAGVETGSLYLLALSGPPHVRLWTPLGVDEHVAGWLDERTMLLHSAAGLQALDLQGRQKTLFTAPWKNK